MKLTNEDKAYLRELGHPETDFAQIEEAIGKTVYTLNFKKQISCAKAIELLGRQTFLSGISRSAFHLSASRQIGDTAVTVDFDSSKLFE